MDPRLHCIYIGYHLYVALYRYFRVSCRDEDTRCISSGPYHSALEHASLHPIQYASEPFGAE